MAARVFPVPGGPYRITFFLELNSCKTGLATIDSSAMLRRFPDALKIL
jgi:hypothetical protein